MVDIIWWGFVLKCNTFILISAWENAYNTHWCRTTNIHCWALHISYIVHGKAMNTLAYHVTHCGL